MDGLCEYGETREMQHLLRRPNSTNGNTDYIWNLSTAGRKCAEDWQIIVQLIDKLGNW